MERENPSLGSWLISRIPVGLCETMARKSVATFSERAGHSLNFTLHWA